jgi:hypothetical protein
MEREFRRIIQSHVSDSKYHALLLLSGGKDSAYILHRMKLEFPELRVLSVVVNNGFMSPVALPGARHCAEKLDTDLMEVNSYIGEFKAVLRQAFLDLRGRGSYGVIDKADGDLIFEIGRDMAKAMRIPIMLGGLSWVQLQKIFNTDDFKVKMVEGVLDVHPLAVWRTNEQDVRSFVRHNDLLPAGSDNPIVSNNALIIPMAVIDILNNGYSSFEPEFAQLVREGKTDRTTWLHTFEILEFGTRKKFLLKELKAGLSKLDLTLVEVLGGKT